jgi:hypothetical protein
MVAGENQLDRRRERAEDRRRDERDLEGAGNDPTGEDLLPAAMVRHPERHLTPFGRPLAREEGDRRPLETGNEKVRGGSRPPERRRARR